MNEQAFTMGDLFARSYCRYVKVTPTGLQISPDRSLSTLCATVITFRPARTLYENRKPACRSLDGIQSVTTRRGCAPCLLRRNCTPQICLDMLYQDIPLRMLLAFTSARNFMQFVSQCQKQGTPVEDTDVLITVRDRGRWGELIFQMPAQPESP